MLFDILMQEVNDVPSAAGSGNFVSEENDMKCRLAVSAVVMVATCFAQEHAPTFNRSCLKGSWKLNWSKSRLVRALSPAQTPSVYREYEDCGDGFMLHTMITVDAAQKRTQLLLTVVKYDGKEYPTYAHRGLAERLLNGGQTPERVSFTVVDDHSMKWTDRTDGKLTGTGTVVLSEDGKTMTDTNSSYGPDGAVNATNVLVYEKE